MTSPPDEYLLIGQIVAAHGLRGQVKLRAFTDRPDHIQQHVRTVFVGEHRRPHRLLALHQPKPGVLIFTLSDITDRTAAEDLRREEVYIAANEAAPLDEDEYFLHDLYGLRVEREDGETLGTVREVIETGANDVLIVKRTSGGELLLPVIRDVIVHLDVGGGRMVVRLLDGLA